MQAGQFRAGSGSARRTVVGFAGTENEIPAVRAGIFRGRKEFHMINFLPVAPGNFILRQRLPDFPRKIGQRLKRSSGIFPARDPRLEKTSCRPTPRLQPPLRILRPSQKRLSHHGNSRRSARKRRPSHAVPPSRRQPGFRCDGVPGRMRPRCASVTIRPIIPCPHIPR